MLILSGSGIKFENNKFCFLVLKELLIFAHFFKAKQLRLHTREIPMAF